jgi:hypothetical protein
VELHDKRWYYIVLRGFDKLTARCLNNQHTIAIGVKAVFLLDGMSVSGKDFVQSCERCHERKQG